MTAYMMTTMVILSGWENLTAGSFRMEETQGLARVFELGDDADREPRYHATH